MSSHAKGFNTQLASATAREEFFSTIEGSRWHRKKKEHRWWTMQLFTHYAEFEFQLYRGEDLFPKTKTMSIRAANKENFRLCKAFMARGMEGPLWSWKIRDFTTFKNIRREFMRAVTTFPKETRKEEALKWLEARGILLHREEENAKV